MGECAFYDVPCWLSWAIEEIRLVFLAMFDSFLQSLVALLAAIPVPDFLQNVSQFQLPSGVVYIANQLQIDTGIAMLVGAYILRFLLRRIPFIGG